MTSFKPPIVAAVVWLAMFASCGAGESPIATTTFTYKTVDGLPVKLDLHRADDDARRPVVVWIHGGALIVGHRAGIDRRAKDLLLDAGYAIVSIDYRLAPETKLPDIISDVEDAFSWLQRHGRQRLNVDVGKVAVIGGSAGGYLTLTAGYRARPRPTVLVSFFGYGDLIGDWYSQPSKHPRHHIIKTTEAVARSQVGGKPISDARDRPGNGGGFYQYCRQHGIWPLEVSGWDPHTQAEKFHPFMPVKNVTEDYPPALLIHGTDDTDVPYEQSVMMVDQFKRHGVEHELITIHGGEHGLGGRRSEED